MNDTVLVQLIVTAGAIISAVFLTVRYSIQQSVKRDKMQIEYYESKNGHMERMADKFTDAFNKNTKALNKLTTQIAVSKTKKSK